MCCIWLSLTLLVQPATASGDPSPGVLLNRPAIRASGGYQAEVEVLGNIPRHGRIIVTSDGRIHLEHLDDATSRWVLRALRQHSPNCNGWSDRPLRDGPMRCVWGRLDQFDVLTEVHTQEGSLKISPHRVLSNR